MDNKTNFICINCEDEYQIKWVEKIINTNPVFNKNMLSFIVISNESRVEINTMDIKRVIRCAKKLSHPKGRSAITSDKVYIYIKEIGGKQKLIGILTHNRIKTFVPVNNKKTLE